MTPDRFEDFADIVNKNRRANACWCLSRRLQAKEITALGGTGPDAREQAMRRLCEREHPPGVVTHLDGTPVGWCNIGPRSETTRLAQSKLMPTSAAPTRPRAHVHCRITTSAVCRPLPSAWPSHRMANGRACRMPRVQVTAP